MEVCALINKVGAEWQILGWADAWDDLVRVLYEEDGIPAEYSGHLIVGIPLEIAKSGGKAVPVQQVTLLVTENGGFKFGKSNVEGEMTFLPVPEPG